MTGWKLHSFRFLRGLVVGGFLLGVLVLVALIRAAPWHGIWHGGLNWACLAIGIGVGIYSLGFWSERAWEEIKGDTTWNGVD